MRVGVTFPTMEVLDPLGVRDLAQAAEDLGYSHLLAWEQVAGADISHRPDWQGVPTLADIHEPLVLFGFLRGLTRRIELATGVLVLPQRQTALVAKQVAELHLLSGGRVRLGLGIGWVRPQFTALGMEWAERGDRLVEQIAVLRALLSTDVVTFHGRWHDIEEMGIRPHPTTPVPIWLGGNADVARSRAVAHADGWMPMFSLAQTTDSGVVARLGSELNAAGRHLASTEAVQARGLRGEGPTPGAGFGLEMTLNLAGDFHAHADRGRSRDDLRAEAQQWAALGVTHLNVNTQGLGLTPQGHLRALTDLWDVLADLPG